MSTGKSAAQAAHAAVEAFRLSALSLIDEWYIGGHYTKIVLEAESEEHLKTIQEYIEERGFSTKLIVDEGRTEIRAHTATALGVEIVNRDDPHTAATFQTFRLYRDDRVPAAPKADVSLTLTRRAAAKLLKGT